MALLLKPDGVTLAEFSSATFPFYERLRLRSMNTQLQTTLLENK